jgi:hypothetical protein
MLKQIQKFFGYGDEKKLSQAQQSPEAVLKLQQAAQARAKQEQENIAMVEKGIAEQLNVAGEAVKTAERLGVIGQQQATEQGALARQQVRGGPRGAASGYQATAAGEVAMKAAAAKRAAKAAADAALLKAKADQATAFEETGKKKQDLLKAQQAKELAKANALADAKQMFQDAINDVYVFFTHEDRLKVAKDIRDSLAGADVETIAAVEEYIRNTVLNPNNDASGVIG